MADNKQIACDVLNAVGGKANVSYVTHCMTRLRFNLKDRSLVDAQRVKAVKGVIGIQESGGQFQVIVGQNVPKVYDELCTQGGFAKQAAIDENLDGGLAKEKLTPKVVGNSILNYLSGSMVPLLPILMSAGFFKTVAVLFGPTMLDIIDETNDLFVLMTMIYNAAFYFLPIYLGFNAAKNIGATPILGAFMGGILIEPSFVSMAAEGTSFSVYGIPCTPITYSQTVVPILLSVFALSAIERFMRKIIPDTLSTIFTPFFTMAIVIPLSLCLLAPLGSWAGNGFSTAFEALAGLGGIFAILACGLLGALWSPLVITGMHLALAVIALANLMATGTDSLILVATTITLWGVYGTELGAWIRLRNPEEKAKALGYLISNMVGGVGEPFIYGIMLRYRKVFICRIIAGFVAGAVAGALGVTVHVAGTASNALNLLAFFGGTGENIVCAVIAAIAGFVTGLVLTILFGFSEDELANGPLNERA